MCLSEVGRVLTVDERAATAVVDLRGRPRAVSLVLLSLEGHPVAAGDQLLVHSGIAVEVLEPGEAALLSALVAEVRDADDRRRNHR